MSDFIPAGLGWHRDWPDPRDVTPADDRIVRMLHDLSSGETRPDRVDQREYCPAVLAQGEWGTSSVCACLSLVRYFERRATGRLIEPSRMFVYKTARRLMNWTGDSGVPLRSTLKAISQFGLPDERLWPYTPDRLDSEPDAFVYAAGADFRSAAYVRLDARGQRPEHSLEIVKRFLAAGFVSVFGFSVCTSLTREADIAAPTIFDGIRGGQAVMAVGYDNSRRIRSDRGALLIASSWGPQWGDGGYGWLPYTYVRERLAVDFWTLLTPRWIAEGDLLRPA